MKTLAVPLMLPGRCGLIASTTAHLAALPYVRNLFYGLAKNAVACMVAFVPAVLAGLLSARPANTADGFWRIPAWMPVIPVTASNRLQPMERGVILSAPRLKPGVGWLGRFGRRGIEWLGLGWQEKRRVVSNDQARRVTASATPLGVFSREEREQIMSADRKAPERLARRALSGRDSHAETREVFSGLDWTAAGSKPRSVPHSVYQLLKHMSYWQDWVVAWLEGERPAVPRHASGSWPAESGPSSRREWDEAVAGFRRGLRRLERACRGADLPSGRGRTSRIEMLHTIAAHNSYHAGQVAFLRQLLRKWPPPSGGVTW